MIRTNRQEAARKEASRQAENIPSVPNPSSATAHVQKPEPIAKENIATPIQHSSSRPNQQMATIGPKIRFKGELVGEEDLLIQGHIDGTIDLKNHHLIVGDKGVIKADVIAKTITIEGTVEGDVFGQERIAIKSSSNVRGNLVGDRVTLEDGAKFKGSIDMDISEHRDKFASSTTSTGVMKSASETTEPA